MAASNENLSKEDRILREKKRLRGVFKDLDKNMLKTVDKLIDRAAFMAVTLQDLEEIINAAGYTAEYQNGENQHGTKKSAEAEIYLTLSKTFAVIIKQLSDLTPPAPKRKSRLEKMMDSD